MRVTERGAPSLVFSARVLAIDHSVAWVAFTGKWLRGGVADIFGLSGIFDAGLTQVVQKRMVKVISWYDNEWGYSTRVEELIGCLAAMDGLSRS